MKQCWDHPARVTVSWPRGAAPRARRSENARYVSYALGRGFSSVHAISS